jgi:predicted enzyme related to lactoylglutathione lyase
MASTLNGKFVWYELVSPDAPAARRFYGKVLGWRARDAEIPGIDYSLLSMSGTDIAGSMQQMDGMPAAWTAYICVDDIEATFASVSAAGATPIIPVAPIPGIGRFSILADPLGATFALVEYLDEFPKPTVPTHGVHGHGWWRELHTSDQEKAFAFYGPQFGWVKTQAIDMGPMGIYQTIAPAEGADANGAMFNDESRPPFWLVYFWVADIDAAHDAVLAGGGQVVNGPHEVPGGAWVIEGRDPQGVTFALVGERTKK